MRIVLGVSGGIAAYKAVLLLRRLREEGHQVDVVPTPAAENFIGRPTWEALSGRPVTTSVFSAVDEVRHVRLGQEADLVVVAPATADLLARARAGMADDLLTSTLLATQAPVVLVPAMHTEMWLHAATQENVSVLRHRGVDVMDPADGRLTGTDTGPGRLPEPEAIHEHLRTYVDGGADHPSAPTPAPSAVPEPEVTSDAAPGAESDAGPLAGRTVLITSGGTREPLDPVRYLGNRSSGKQGAALARAALAAGAHVHVIAGIMEVEIGPPSERLTVEHIETAQQLQAAVERQAPGIDVMFMAAAVADFRPRDYAASKIKKTSDGQSPVIELERNPDILAGTVRRRQQSGLGPRLIVGFAAETGSEHEEPLQLAQEKLVRKGCELLVLNTVSQGRVFGQDDTEVHILSSFSVQAVLGEAEPVTVRGSKDEAARAVVASAVRVLEASSTNF